MSRHQRTVIFILGARMLKQCGILALSLALIVASAHAQSPESLKAARQRELRATVDSARAVNGPGYTEVKYDRFKNQTLVTLRPLSLGGGLALSVLSAGAGSQPAPVPLVLLLLTYDGPIEQSWRYLKCHGLDLLGDEKAIAVGTATHDGEAAGGRLFERVTAPIASRALARWVNATTAEGKLCNTEFTLSPSQLAAARDFLAHIKLPAK